MEGFPNNMGAPAQITAAQFAAKYNSKREVYRFVSVDCGAYVSSMETMTVWHLRDLAMGKKKMIKCNQVAHIELPHFEGLEVDKILNFARVWHQGPIMMYLPAVEHEIL